MIGRPRDIAVELSIELFQRADWDAPRSLVADDQSRYTVTTWRLGISTESAVPRPPSNSCKRPTVDVALVGPKSLGLIGSAPAPKCLGRDGMLIAGAFSIRRLGRSRAVLYGDW